MTELSDELALEVRAGLPDALRVLVEEYPREGWERHPEFSQLIRFWLERHLMFRRLQAMLRDETQGFLDAERAPEAFGRGLARLAGTLVNDLHGHHRIEDLHYFPVLQRLDGRAAAGFDLLDADHVAIDPLLQRLADRTNAVLRALPRRADATGPAGRLLGELTRLEALLDRHLTDEEELVVPVLLAHPEAGIG